MTAWTSEALGSALASILPEGVEVAAGRIGAVPLDVWEEERGFAQTCVASRRQEFLTGRALARSALRRLGCEDAPLLSGPSGAPCWPHGVTGSISHAGSLCLVAVADAHGLRGVGVDVEPAEPLEQSLWPEICSEIELGWLTTRTDAERGFWARWFFSAKEAVYKLQSPLTGIFLGFHDVELRTDEPALRAGHFRATVPSTVRERLGCEVSGRWVTEAGFLLTAATLPS